MTPPFSSTPYELTQSKAHTLVVKQFKIRYTLGLEQECAALYCSSTWRPSWPLRISSLQTPPGPEGSNGRKIAKCEARPAGEPPFSLTLLTSPLQ